MLHLCPSAPGNDQTDTRLFLRHIIPAHSSSLTSIVVQPKYAGSWCFDIPMLKALLLCTNLEHIAISIDMQRAQVKHNENVITKLLKNVQHWHSLRQLEIAAISTDPTARSPSTADEEKSLKEDICVRIVNCLMKFGCRDLTLQMLKLMVDTDFIYNLQPCLFESDSQIYIFLPPRLPGMRDGMEAIPILDKIEGEFIHFIYILPE
ncbi:uncharacterized protein BT62DRAFT_468655 [Guyanagaster necrorhizus]|uniref:Uncharacterized protein n=1 Tax=Guyanagaster necrorhizus TaxID=856835 RepID=A0A9P8AN33_9AGAR|nr:uncharacterized protein BT62DRAFT_468655 [Guyanagaster necrorhizus MCA 3950]KAG7441888.1 hypothetical protein BT62DRAFT_468655 [Guyanagaster necrorhizus MCA 3950]